MLCVLLRMAAWSCLEGNIENYWVQFEDHVWYILISSGFVILNWRPELSPLCNRWCWQCWHWNLNKKFRRSSHLPVQDSQIVQDDTRHSIEPVGYAGPHPRIGGACSRWVARLGLGFLCLPEGDIAHKWLVHPGYPWILSINMRQHASTTSSVLKNPGTTGSAWLKSCDLQCLHVFKTLCKKQPSHVFIVSCTDGPALPGWPGPEVYRWVKSSERRSWQKGGQNHVNGCNAWTDAKWCKHANILFTCNHPDSSNSPSQIEGPNLLVGHECLPLSYGCCCNASYGWCY